MSGGTSVAACGDEPVSVLAAQIARRPSGFALWPALVLDEAEDIVVWSRGPDGEPRRSNWQTIVALTVANPEAFEAGSGGAGTLTAQLGVDVPQGVLSDTRYSLKVTCS